MLRKGTNRKIKYYHNSNRIPLNVLFLFLILSFSMYNVLAFQPTEDNLTITERLEREVFVDSLEPLPKDFSLNERIEHKSFISSSTEPLTTLTFYKGTIIYINYTVLLYSNCSVEFEYIYSHWNDTFWSPDPPKTFILAPGESYAGNFTLLIGRVAGHADFGFEAIIVMGGTNATVAWWYEVLKEAKPASTLSFLATLGSLTIITGVLIFLKKRKRS